MPGFQPPEEEEPRSPAVMKQIILDANLLLHCDRNPQFGTQSCLASLNNGGATPMTVYGCRLILMVRLMMDESAPKCVCHKR